MQLKTPVARLLLVATIASAAPTAEACSALTLQIAGSAIMVRNYDWHIGHALVMMNQPGIAKRALSFDNPAEWTSKYGSVTVNQYGRELPCDGINEAGLAIAILWLEESEYPPSDERPSVNTAQWVQYQLDTAETVADVIASDEIIRITPYGGAKVHYFVTDAAGDCAVIEFLDGQLVAHCGTALPHKLITNSTCTESCNYLTEHQGFGGERSIPGDSESLSRYVRLASLAASVDSTGKAPHMVALDTIQQASQRTTRWQIAYDVEAKTMYFRTENHAPVRIVNLAKCDFDPAHPVMVLDLEASLDGDVVSEFREYTRDANKRLIERSTAATEFTRNLPASLIQIAIDYPDIFCHPVASPAVLRR
jgi:penicillin V acylase-like amidase (Ntn superfamily)